MRKIIYFWTIQALIFILSVNMAIAVTTQDKQAIIDECKSYGLDVQAHYPKMEPTTADDYYKLGVAYLFGNMPQAAAEQFRKAIELNPNHADSLMGLSVSTAQLGDIKNAMGYSTKALKIEPNNAKIHNLLGALHIASASSLGNLDQAEISFKKAVSLDSNFIASRINLARLYVSRKNLTEAIKEYEAIVKIQPDNLTAYTELSRAYLYTNSLDKAAQAAEKVLTLSPQNPASRNILGEIYEGKGQLDKAIEEYRKSVELEPTYATGYKNIGRVYVQKGLPDMAIMEFRKALSYRPNYGEAHSGLGDAYMIKGMTQQAIEEYKNTIEILPVSGMVSAPAYNNLAYLYAEDERNLDEALSWAQKAKKLAPDQPDIADTLGWIYYKKGLYNEALENFKEAAKGSPDNPAIRYHLAMAYHKQGNKQEAIIELKKSLSNGRNFREARDAGRLLSELSGS